MGRELNTKSILKDWEAEIKERISSLQTTPRLIIVSVGDKNESNLYVNNKLKKAKELGIDTLLLKLGNDITQKQLNTTMCQIDAPAILQLPIPRHLNSDEALSYLRPEYDVDGLTIYQKGLLVSGSNEAMIPATALGVIRLLESETDISGKKVAIISRSELIGKPLFQLILQKNGYPVVLHSKIGLTKILCEMANSDVVVTGCGQRAIFDHRCFRTSGQILIDCSMNKLEGIVGVGDMLKEDILIYTDNTIASGYGHTGPATVLGLMNNVVKYYEMV